MKIVIAADKFKGSLDCFQVCDAIAAGLQQSMPGVHITKLPLSDGGEGLADVMAYYTGAEKINVTVSDPLFRPVQAQFLLSADGKTAIIEMAQASGLLLLHPQEYNPLQTTTYGTGQLIKAALQQGVSKIILGIGGSATNDCGIGMAAALGYAFLDANGQALKPVGENLGHIQTIDTSNKINLDGVSIEVACDVTNYLTGEAGAAKIYAPQKGASPEMVEALEKGILHFAALVKQQLGVDLNALKGGGAAGGMGAGSVLFLNAAMRSGVQLLLHYSHAEKHIKAADLVITGEGKLDVQSLQGKVVHGVAESAKMYIKPVIALCGTLDISVDVLNRSGIAAAFSILQKPMSLEEAMESAECLLVQSACNLGNVLKMCLK
jgi:glycerate 2-kinase